MSPDRQPTETFEADRAVAESTPHTSAFTPTPGPESPPEDPLPREFGRYTLQRLLGKGGMGRVYLAHDPHLDRLVALKMPNPVEGVAGWRDRFKAEARAAATLNHPNVCPVYDVGEVDGQPYLTMTFIDGETLAAKLHREGPFSPAAAVELVRTVARAMHEAHRCGIVHRDLKPANLMLDPAGRPVVMDFGLAIRSTNADDLRLTLTGVALGTPAYMPPEQAGGDHDAIGPPADVYSLGVILFELVTGRPPFRARSFGKLLAQIERDPPPFPSSLNPAVDAALEAVILTALAKSPTDRFASAGDLADALDRYQQGDRFGLVSLYSKPYVVPNTTGEYRPSPSTTAEYPKHSRRGWWLAGAAAFLIALVAGAVIYVETDYGQLVIQLNDPTAKVDVKVNGQHVTLAVEGGKPIRIKAGANQKLEVSGPDFDTVSESFDMKRGDVTVARVTLKPKADVAKKGPDPKVVDPPKIDPPKRDPVAVEPPKKDPPKMELPKPVAYPKQATLIEVPGWQILTDATREESEKWLAERKKAKQSVTWVDSYQLRDKPVFCAVAALDEREPGWTVLWDVPPEDVGKMPLLKKRLDTEQNRLVAGSGFVFGGKPGTVLLWWPGKKRWGLTADPTITTVPEFFEKGNMNGYVVRLVRPYLTEEPLVLCMAYMEFSQQEMTEGRTFSALKLQEFFDTARKNGRIPLTLAGYLSQGVPAFATVAGPNAENLEWQTDTTLTAAELKTKAATLAEKGFRPASVTAYAWDGAVRYCVVWVKEPPKPVAYPKQATLIETPGWEMLTDATKDEMQAWLAQRKKDKHSVTWLDAAQVGDKPLFSAVAALDDRQPGWTVMLDESITEASSVAQLRKKINTEQNWLVSISAYFKGEDDIRVAFLWYPGYKRWAIDLTQLESTLQEDAVGVANDGSFMRICRPYSAGEKNPRYVVYTEILFRGSLLLKFGVNAEKLATYLEEQRKSGTRPLSVSAVATEAGLKFTTVCEPNKQKWEWEVTHGATAGEFKAKAEDFAKKGFRPSCVTAYGWDGAVRYCVVWVKEPPKPVPYPKQATLIETPGWEMLTDATQAEMQAWLDARKKDKHSVMWLDAASLNGKPVFAAVAALDDREPKWTAMLDERVDDVNAITPLATKIDPKANRIVSFSGYVRGEDAIHMAILWQPGGRTWLWSANTSETGLDDTLPMLVGKGFFPRLMRSYSTGEKRPRYAMLLETVVRGSSLYKFGAYAEELATYLAEQRKNGAWPLSVSAVATESGLQFTTVCESNKQKWEWEVTHGATAGEFKAKAEEFGKKGFRPGSVTAYPWDGAVRYCVVWVKDAKDAKDPPKK